VRRIGLVAFLVLILLCSGCASEKADADVQVVVAIQPQAYFVETLGGDRVQVMVMIPPGANPATYEPAPAQLRALAGADLYLGISPLPFEQAWRERLLSVNPVYYDSAEGIELDGGDPHIWLSPSLVTQQAKNITAALCEVDEQAADYYQERLEAFLAELSALDQELAESLAGLAGTRFLVYHPAWHYLAREYGLEQVAIEVEGNEPGAGQLAELIEQARAENVRVLFVSPQHSQRSARMIAEEIGAQVVEIDPLARDWAGNLHHVAAAFQFALGESRDGDG
jgi:zinc transport system substrate-binding protein